MLTDKQTSEKTLKQCFLQGLYLWTTEKKGYRKTSSIQCVALVGLCFHMLFLQIPVCHSQIKVKR
jgi:hypothetical protein